MGHRKELSHILLDEINDFFPRLGWSHILVGEINELRP
jgi:hypothetical protein